MIIHGNRWEALAQWWRCPKNHLLLKQAGLIFLILSPHSFLKIYRAIRRQFFKSGKIAAAVNIQPLPVSPKAVRFRPKSPFFSVVIPVYNKKDYLRRSVKSVLAQTFADFELIVVDDGSQDGSPKIVRSLKDKRIRLILQKNAGVAAARNRGVAAAKGSYVAFLDADDDWAPGYLAALRALIQDYPGAGLYGTNYWIDNGKERLENPVNLPAGWRGRMRDYYGLCYYRRPPFCTNTVCLPVDLARATPFPLGIKSGEDLLVWFKVSLRHETVYLHRPFSTYYLEANENTHKVYFGSRYHLDWLDLGEKFKKAKLLSKSAQKYVVWITLIQTRKMLAAGRRRDAWAKWRRCPMTYFPLYWAALLFMFVFPLKQRKDLRPFFFFGPQAVSPSVSAPAEKLSQQETSP
jgi:glycosyltransferase involved in cell wall biosynthesis